MAHLLRNAALLPLLSWAMVCCSMVAVASGQQTITLLETTRTEGVIKSVSAGMIEITDANGQDAKFKIQDKDRPGVSLAGAKAVIDFPAKVEVSGTLTPDALAPGTLVRFTAKLNRLGRTEGSLDRILVFDENRFKPGVTVEKPAEGQGFATCVLCGDVASLRNGRLTVNVPKSDFVRSQKLTFPLAEKVVISTESDDYRRARPGDKVRLSAARFDTGDAVIREISITLAPRTKEKERDRGKASPAEASKYRQLSDAPSPPRDLQSPHFLLHTDISDRSAKMLLDKLETMITLVSQYFGRNPVGLIECYVVRDLAQWPERTFPPEAVAKIQEPAGVTLSLTVGQTTRSVVYSCDQHGVVQHESDPRLLLADVRQHGADLVFRGLGRNGALLEKGPSVRRSRTRGHRLPETRSAQEDARHRGGRPDHRRFVAELCLALGAVLPVGQQPELLRPVPGTGHRHDEQAAGGLVRERVRTGGQGNLLRVRPVLQAHR